MDEEKVGDPITIERGNLQELFDIIVSSLDYGSGMLDKEQVDILRRTAEQIGLDPMLGTPHDDRHRYPHPFTPQAYYYACRVCGQPQSHSAHAETTTP